MRKNYVDALHLIVIKCREEIMAIECSTDGKLPEEAYAQMAAYNRVIGICETEIKTNEEETPF